MDDISGWLDRMKAVDREYLAVRQAVGRLRDLAMSDPTVLVGGVTPQDLINASEALEGTFVIRLYAEFEAGLRTYWSRVRDSTPRMEQLLESIAVSLRVADEVRARLHEVRIYRNSLVHDQDEAIRPIPIAEVRHRLCMVFSRLPRRWPLKRC